METDFEESNIALLGSDFEKELRKERAEAEPQWQTAGTKVGIQIWRIEKFNVVPWPEEEYGNFFSGDTYIILSTKNKPGSDALEHDAHMWVGNETTKDEAGTAAYKIVELDDHFDGKANLYYEPQDYESKMFNSYFKVINIQKGGIETGFTKVPVEQYRPRLLRVSGFGNNVHSSEVPLHFKSLNFKDVFVLDAGTTIINWRGKDASAFEKFHAAALCEKIQGERHCKIEVIDVEQGDRNPEFIKYIKEGSMDDIKEKIQQLTNKKGYCKVIKKISDENGTINLTDVEYKKESLTSHDAFLIDSGDVIYVWIGKEASKKEKRLSIVFAQKYLVINKRPLHIPIISVVEGNMESEIDKCFE